MNRMWVGILLAAMSTPACVTAAGAESIDAPTTYSAHDTQSSRRGSISIGYQVQHTRGLETNLHTTVGTGATTDTHALNLALDYRLGDRWELHVSVPYIRKRTSGPDRNTLPPGAHTLQLVPNHPAAEFIDDGDYHGNLQDWTAGVSYHTHWRGFDARPRILAIVPSHDYPFYGNAATGQRLWRLRLGVELSRRIGLSEWWYVVGYDYEIWQKVLGMSLNKHYLEASLGYAIRPDVSVRLWGVARRGQGTDYTQIDRNCRCEFWYQNDRHNRHEYTIAGLGMSWRPLLDWTVSATTGKMYWGSTVHDLRHLHALQVSRDF